MSLKHITHYLANALDVIAQAQPVPLPKSYAETSQWGPPEEAARKRAKAAASTARKRKMDRAFGFKTSRERKRGPK